MLYYEIRHFLANHQGYYCVDCLAVRLDFTVDEVRRSVGQDTFAEIAIAYRICQDCLDEKATFALRASA